MQKVLKNEGTRCGQKDQNSSQAFRGLIHEKGRLNMDSSEAGIRNAGMGVTESSGNSDPHPIQPLHKIG